MEHYYQAQKFAGKPEEEMIRCLKKPGGAKGFAHAKKHLWLSNWDDLKVDVMREAVHAKFFQSGFLARELILTGSAILIENSPSDDFWGTGSNGKGKNMLGQILMETRENLRKVNY